MTRAGMAAGLLLIVVGVGPASAQTPQMPVEPSVPARVQFGPLALRPSLILREVGYDSNVLHRPEGDEGDFTATFGARADLWLKSSRVQGIYSSYYEYLYFESFEEERGSNGGVDGRVDVLFERLRPYFTAGINSSHERPSAEIDARALRVSSNVGGGVALVASSRTSFHVGFRHTDTDFADSEIFRGVRLADALNGTSNIIAYGVDFVISPFTTLSAHGERATDRFDESTERDANSYRYGVTATLHPLALISGRASVGVRAFRPETSQLRQFTGVTAAVAVSYAIQEDTRIGLTFDRDLRYSFAELTPYYISTLGRLTVTQRLFGDFDGQVFGGVERIGYEARLDIPGTVDETDHVRLVGAGLAYRLGDGSRLGLNVDYATRKSPADEREYSRGRLYATLNYGF